MTKFAFDGSWHEIKGKLRQEYSQLTDDDVQFVEGKSEELMGRLQSKLELSAKEVNAVLRKVKTEMIESGALDPGAIHSLKGGARKLADDIQGQVAEISGNLKHTVAAKAGELKAGASDLYDGASTKARTVYHDAEEYVRKETFSALLTAMVAGFIVGLLLPRR
jgi:uncharacterized protein YjbJ (UPF0337 family)